MASTPSSTDPIQGYDHDGAAIADRYEQLSAEEVHAAFLSLLPSGFGRTALDVGAGSGRDAAWLMRRGFDVVAVEPAAGMREAAQARHPEAGIRWLDDRLPSLTATRRLGLGFDLILLSGVFMHVRPDDRDRAFGSLVTLLRPGGMLLMSVRTGSGAIERPMWPVPPEEIDAYVAKHGLTVLTVADGQDLHERADVLWTSYALQRPTAGPFTSG